MPTLTEKEAARAHSVAVRAAKAAGKILKEGFSKRMRIAYKGRINPVTEYDLKAEKAIVRILSRAYPDHAILTEEGTDRETRSDYLWVIDPLDGTVNYAHGFPVYCVSVALLFRGKPVVGVVYDPERKELFHAIHGSGARINQKKISVTAEKDIERALLATGFSYSVRRTKQDNVAHFGKMIKTAQGVRRPGSAAIDLCWLAAGRLDGFWEFDLHPWDTAAAILMVAEAGGKVSQIDGSPYSIYDKNILASNRYLHGDMRKILSRVGRTRR